MRYTLLPLAAVLVATACADNNEKTEKAAATMTVDTAAVKTGADAIRNSYMALLKAGDATGLAALYSDQAGVDLYGAPRVRGKPALEAFFKADFGARKYTVAEITPGSFQARTNSEASELGTYHTMHDAKGKQDHEWGRYLVAFGKGADGKWRLDYLIAFPDSVKPAK